jgi:hypothetical protein
MAKREAELNINGINDDNSWLLPMRLRTLPLQQEAAELKQETAMLRKINAELSTKLLRLQRQAAIQSQPQRVEAPAPSLAQV